MLPGLDAKFRYAVEVRHAAWFQDLAYNFFANNNLCLVWSQLAELQTPPILTTEFLYLRFIGDRSIQEKDFGRIQIDRVLEMQKWAENIKAIQDERVEIAIVTANNHYAGFGPGTAKVFCSPKIQQAKDMIFRMKKLFAPHNIFWDSRMTTLELKCCTRMAWSGNNLPAARGLSNCKAIILDESVFWDLSLQREALDTAERYIIMDKAG